MKRNIDILVISDLHLGTYGSEADEVLSYLKTIDAKKIVINGDFVDILLFNKNWKYMCPNLESDLLLPVTLSHCLGKKDLTCDMAWSDF